MGREETGKGCWPHLPTPPLWGHENPHSPCAQSECQPQRRPLFSSGVRTDKGRCAALMQPRFRWQLTRRSPGRRRLPRGESRTGPEPPLPESPEAWGTELALAPPSSRGIVCAHVLQLSDPGGAGMPRGEHRLWATSGAARAGGWAPGAGLLLKLPRKGALAQQPREQEGYRHASNKDWGLCSHADLPPQSAGLFFRNSTCGPELRAAVSPPTWTASPLPKYENPLPSRPQGTR